MLTHPLAQMVDLWLEKIEESKKVKYDRFQKYADEAMKFYDGAHNFMWDEQYSGGKDGFLSENAFGSDGVPYFKMTVNRPFEAVALFGPTLFARYPQVRVTTVRQPQVSPEAIGLNMQDPNQVMQYQQLAAQNQMRFSVQHSCAQVKEHYLNWLQVETDKKTHARKAITEAIVKGMGCLYTEVYSPPGSEVRYPRSVYLNVDDYFKDPDAAYNEDVQWIAIRRVQPVHLVEEKYGLPAGTLKGHMQSMESQSFPKAKREKKSGKNKTHSHDLLEYYEVFSKSGFGDKLKSSPNKIKVESGFNTDKLGRYCYLAVSKDIPFPLNMPTEAIKQESEEELFMRAQWPVPFWTDDGLNNGWPVSELYFYEKPGCVWPISLIKPAIGELRFINWCMSFLADKVASSCTTYVAMLKSAAREIKEQVENGNGPYKVLEISEMTGQTIQQVVSFLQAPSFDVNIWKMVSEVSEQIDKRIGLTELIYGIAGTQIRSAREADIRNANVSIRPDDMAEKTEDWLSSSCMKEMETAAWVLEQQDVAPAVGLEGSMVFMSAIKGGQFESLVRDYSYRIEAGSARKPNKANRLSQLNDFGKISLPVMQAYAMQGITGPWNAFVQDYARALDLDGSPYVVEVPQKEPSPQEQAAMQHEQAKMAMEQQKIQTDLQKSQLDVVGKQMDLQAKQADADISATQEFQKIQDTMLEQREKQVDTANKMQQMELSAANSLLKLDILRAQKDQLNAQPSRNDS